MSDVRLTQLEVAQDLDQRRCLTTAAAAQLLGIERRQVARVRRRPDASLRDLEADAVCAWHR
jgi:hypothetical protein